MLMNNITYAAVGSTELRFASVKTICRDGHKLLLMGNISARSSSETGKRNDGDGTVIEACCFVLGIIMSFV